MSSELNLINTEQAAKLVGCSISSFKGYLSRGALYPCKKLGGRNFYSEESIKKFRPPSKSGNDSQRSKKLNKTWRRFCGTKSIVPDDLRNVIEKWKTSAFDTGSADVQIGVYTEKIQQIEADMKGVSYQDPVFANMRTLLIKYVFERRRLLNYLQISDYGRYRRAIALLESSKASR